MEPLVRSNEDRMNYTLLSKVAVYVLNSFCEVFQVFFNGENDGNKSLESQNIPLKVPLVAKKSSTLIVTGGVDCTLKVWGLEQIKMDLKWKRRRSWAIFVSLCRKSYSVTATNTESLSDIECYFDDSMKDWKKLCQLPHFRRFIQVDDLCGEVACYL